MVRAQATCLASIALAGALLFLSVPSGATGNERLDIDQHSLLIQKLDAARSGLGKGSAEFLKISIRLSDLLSDRARAFSLNGDETSAAKDRSKALGIYGSITTLVQGEEKVRILLHKAHLELLVKSPKVALTSLDLAVKVARRQNQTSLARALGQRGELSFSQKDFKSANRDLKEALRADPQSKSTHLWSYRLAWCELNLGQILPAKERLHKLLNQSDLDSVLRADALNDLVVFIARQPDVTDADMDELLALGPDAERRQRLKSLAEELERLGKKKEATIAWGRLSSEGESSKTEDLAQTIHRSQLLWDMDKRAEALEDYSQALSQWSDKTCGDEATCQDLSKRLKNFLITWHKTEKERPSPLLLSAYKAYTDRFSTDTIMLFQAGDAARSAQDHSQATNFFLQAAQHNPEGEMQEAALAAAIEESEKTKEPNLRLAAYNEYLRIKPNGPLSYQVKYQIAYLYYQKKDTQTALDRFSELVALPPVRRSDRQLRVNAADLSLDLLARENRDLDLLNAARAWAPSLPERKLEFARLERQAAIRISSHVLRRKDSSSSELKKSLEYLEQSKRIGETYKERRDIIAQKLLISYRIMDPRKVSSAAQDLLRLKPLSKEDREMALSHLVWVAELEMNFAEAYRRAQEMKWPSLSPKQRAMKLAVLAHLAGKPARTQYERAISLTSSKNEANALRSTIVRQANDPWRELDRQWKHLKSSPSLSAELVMEVFERTGDLERATLWARKPEISRQPSIAILRRQDWVQKFISLQKTITFHRLVAHSDRLLKSSLQERLQNLKKIENLGRLAQKSSFVLGEFATAKLLARENLRLHNDLLKLPAPSQLKGTDRERYTALLRKQAEPFKTTSTQLDKQSDSLIPDSQRLDLFEKDFSHSAQPLRQLIHREWKVALEFLPSRPKRRVESILSIPLETPSIAEFQKLKAQLKSNPFDVDYLERFKVAAAARHDYLLASYLDSRKSQLQRGGLLP